MTLHICLTLHIFFMNILVPSLFTQDMLTTDAKLHYISTVMVRKKIFVNEDGVRERTLTTEKFR